MLVANFQSSVVIFLKYSLKVTDLEYTRVLAVSRRLPSFLCFSRRCGIICAIRG